jgi:hypothetical protein
MLFEEFFKKKRVDLDALQKGRPKLFSEFKTHYEQMGEKSFDHTKKYWFNKIRREYPLPIETKTEKVKIDNPLAEQTVTESLVENGAPSPKLGFVPKFKAASIPKLAAETPEEIKSEDTSLAAPAPKLGFTPKFKTANVSKPASEIPEEPKSEDTPPAAPAPKLGFTPKFKAANMPKPADQPAEDIKSEEKPETPVTPKLGFTPKFKAANMPKPTETVVPPQEEKTEDTPAPAEDTAPKPAYKPRFNMKNLPKKDEE